MFQTSELERRTWRYLRPYASRVLSMQYRALPPPSQHRQIGEKEGHAQDLTHLILKWTNFTALKQFYLPTYNNGQERRNAKERSYYKEVLVIYHVG